MMNKEESIEYFSILVREVKRSFELPVILLTMKDYADGVFNSLVYMRETLLGDVEPERMAHVIRRFHVDWLHAVGDVEHFKRRIRDTPREHVCDAIDFTIQYTKNRFQSFQKYIAGIEDLTLAQNEIMNEDIATIEEMQENLISALLEKQNCFTMLADQTEYRLKTLEESNELLNWLDTINDNLAAQYSTVVGYKFPELTSSLMKSLDQIVEELLNYTDPDAIKGESMTYDSRNPSSLLGISYEEGLKSNKIMKNIKKFEDRVNKFKNNHSSAVMILNYTNIYLEQRESSIENLKTSLQVLKDKRSSSESVSKRDNHMFDHLLPEGERCRLVNDLMKVWNQALYCCNVIKENKSITVVVSTPNVEDFHTDELGEYKCDIHGRKLYRGDDDSLFQVDEKGQLIRVCDDDDDDKRVYFYDECGRYYLDPNNEHIYSAFKNASEYMLNKHDGEMLKVKEFRKGKVFFYDNLGRYFIHNGKQIYQEKDGADYYESNGYGSLNKIRDIQPEYTHCTQMEPVVTEDSKYLQTTVGAALRKCIAEVVLQQPEDPIKYLAKSLEKYWHSLLMHQKQLVEAQALSAERERRLRTDYQALTTNISEYGEENTSFETHEFTSF